MIQIYLNQAIALFQKNVEILENNNFEK